MDLRQGSCTRTFLNKHWSEKYVMIPFIPYNCAGFVESILKQEFGCDIQFPQTTLNRNEDIKLMSKVISKFTKTDNPEDGDVVLMNGSRESCHVGVFVKIKNVNYVLHTEARLKVSSLHRISDLPNFNYFLNGFYKWK